MEEIEERGTRNGTVQKLPVSETVNPKFWLSEPDKVEDGEGDWSFSLCAEGRTFLASFAYPTQAEAMRGRIAMEDVLKGAVFIATCES
jgi:hypothetical protein